MLKKKEHILNEELFLNLENTDVEKTVVAYSIMALHHSKYESIRH